MQQIGGCRGAGGMFGKVSTVEVHPMLLRKPGVSSRTQAVAEVTKLELPALLIIYGDKAARQ